METKIKKDIALKSEPMNEMLSNPPSWIVLSGSGVFLLVLIIIVSLTWFIQYPDEISGDVSVSTSKPPIELSNQSYIQLKTLDVKENSNVKSGELIAQFDIQANTKDIQRINDYLKLIKINENYEQIIEFNEDVKLGTFQESWTKLNYLIHSWNNEIKSDISDKRIGSIGREIELRKQLQSINDNRINISSEEFQLIKKELESSERLADKNAISKQALTIDKKSHSQALQNFENQKEQKIQNLITLNNLQNELIQLKHNNSILRNEKRAEIQISISTLQNTLDSWKRNSVWVAPCSGKVLFNKILQINRFYKANEASIVIVPSGSGYTAISSINSEGAGRVQPGQKVFIELLDFPKSEYGTLEGTVNTITQIDKEGKYEVKIRLKNQLKTSYDKQIPYKAKYKGTAKIITKNKRLLYRFFEQLTDLIK